MARWTLSAAGILPVVEPERDRSKVSAGKGESSAGGSPMLQLWQSESNHKTSLINARTSLMSLAELHFIA